MALPDTTQAGDTITLTLLSASPRPTFVLGEASGAVEEAIANILQNTATTTQIGKIATITSDQPTLPQEQTPGSATASLSQAGRMVDNLLHAAQLDGASTVIRGQLPILATPQFKTDALAESLHKTLEYSGLFYESHVAQWVNGERSIEELMREPQAHADNDMARSALINNMKGEHSLIDVMRALEAAQQNTVESTENPSHNQSQILTLNNETARLINLQLEALEHKRIEWQGELWPGQRFMWEVSEETPRQASGVEQASSWRSTVRFDMPSLGTIAATIHLTNGRVQMHIQTTNEASASKLRINGSRLADALETAGSPLDLLTVNLNEST
jgi:hypothetical protein